jgi:multisubunit Na+/H+ antiporter MnhG subunit
MSNLMRVPPTESRLARGTRQAAGGALVVVIGVVAIYLIIHAIFYALVTIAVIAAIAAIVWKLLLGRR